jgi:hypothetical protein
MSELVSVTTVPPAGAAAPSVTVHVAEPPLPPAMTDGLQARDVTVCAWAVDGNGTHAISARPMAIEHRFAAAVDLTGCLLIRRSAVTEGLPVMGTCTA